MSLAKFFVTILSIVFTLLVISTDGKFLSGLFGGKGAGCSPSANLLQLPRLTLSSLLCPRPYGGNYMSGWGSYPSYGGGYGHGSMYPAMTGAAYATSSAYPSYTGGSYWNSPNSWSYSPSAWYGGVGGSPYYGGRNDQRKSRELLSSSKTPPAQNSYSQQPIQQQIESNNEYNSNNNNFASSRFSYGGINSKFNSISPSKFGGPSGNPTPSRVNSNEIIQQQILQY